MNKEPLIQAGIDIDNVLQRLMGNETLMERFLKKFEQDTCYHDLLDAAKRQDIQQAMTASHTLKGVSANLSMTQLYDLTTKQVDLLRDNKAQEAFALIPQIQAVYETLVTTIRGE